MRFFTSKWYLIYLLVALFVLAPLTATNTNANYEETNVVGQPFTTYKLTINGKEIKGEDYQPYAYKDTVYVPLDVVLKEMSVKYSWTDKLHLGLKATIDGKEHTFNATKSTVSVNGENKPISVIDKNGTKTPSGLKPRGINYVLFVPKETLTQVLGYDVVLKKSGLKVTIDVKKGSGKETSEVAKIPTPPKKYERNTFINNMVDHYEFTQYSDTAIMYNPYKPGNETYYGILVAFDEEGGKYEAGIYLKAWNYDDVIKEQQAVPKRVKYILQHFYPDSYETIYKLIDDAYNGKMKTAYFNRTLKYDGRTLHMNSKSGRLMIFVGYK